MEPKGELKRVTLRLPKTAKLQTLDNQLFNAFHENNLGRRKEAFVVLIGKMGEQNFEKFAGDMEIGNAASQGIVDCLQVKFECRLTFIPCPWDTIPKAPAPAEMTAHENDCRTCGGRSVQKSDPKYESSGSGRTAQKSNQRATAAAASGAPRMGATAAADAAAAAPGLTPKNHLVMTSCLVLNPSVDPGDDEKKKDRKAGGGRHHENHQGCKHVQKPVGQTQPH